MKKFHLSGVLTFFIWLIVLALNGQSTAPNPIWPITHEWHEADYYAQQAREWEEIAKNDDCNTMAWYHYYMAAHYANFFDHSPEFDLDAIRAAAEEQLTEADFALHYIRCRREHDSEARWRHIFAAHAAEPDRPEAYEGIATYHLVHGNQAEMREYLDKYQATQPFPIGILTWNYNQLNSVARNGVLVTFGDNDTYGSLILQELYGMRPDVQIVNMALFNFFPQYRKQICQMLNIQSPVEKSAQAALEGFITSERDIHLGVGAPPELIDANAEDLYLTGLAFQYSNTPLNNFGQLVDNYENKWRIDDVWMPMDSAPRRRVSQELEPNYLPAFFELHNHYKTNNPAEAKKLEQMIYRIARDNGLEEEIQDYFD